MTETNLKLPWAYDRDRNLVRIADAAQGTPYFCPACETPLILKQGDQNASHFAHQASSTCRQEVIIHSIATSLVQHAVKNWKIGEAPPPTLKRTCQVCQIVVEQAVPNKVTDAIQAYHLANEFIADVALLVDDQPAAVIEVKVTPPTEGAKTAQPDLPFIEVAGQAILDNPRTWIPIIDHFNPLTCPKCSQLYHQFQAKTAQIAQRTKVTRPTAYYRYAPSRCWRCQKEILVFTWPGRYMHETKQPPHQPLPLSVQHRYSKTIHSAYWANTCPYCQTLQGDFFLFAELGGAFFGFECGQDTPEAFQLDLMMLAYLPDSLADYFGDI